MTFTEKKKAVSKKSRFKCSKVLKIGVIFIKEKKRTSSFCKEGVLVLVFGQKAIKTAENSY